MPKPSLNEALLEAGEIAGAVDPETTARLLVDAWEGARARITPGSLVAVQGIGGQPRRRTPPPRTTA